ncbi:uncharacterized protein PV09_02095 [Verruconis gallopava]|uniref:Uncharacterized protein n=1 Tax=Verruconis gallopava TaxID=253628 RepID=A0A0D2B7L1_9PEZI|nr:uncharacterized protein PV09_02095 [Verruconis gallopava]KIW07239.1 hypothetical protein PV09_02095 [Verruconis gallopava]
MGEELCSETANVVEGRVGSRSAYRNTISNGERRWPWRALGYRLATTGIERCERDKIDMEKQGRMAAARRTTAEMTDDGGSWSTGERERKEGHATAEGVGEGRGI